MASKTRKTNPALRLPPSLRCAVSPEGTLVACTNRTRLQVSCRSDGTMVHEAKVKDASYLSFRDAGDLLALTTRGELSLHSPGARSVVWREVVCDTFGGMVLTASNEVRVGCGSQIAVPGGC